MINTDIMTGSVDSIFLIVFFVIVKALLCLGQTKFNWIKIMARVEIYHAPLCRCGFPKRWHEIVAIPIRRKKDCCVFNPRTNFKLLDPANPLSSWWQND